MKIREITEYSFDLKKSLRLREERGFGFEEIISMLEEGDEADIYPHPNPKYPHQYIFEIVLDDYVYIVPFVADGTKVFLKTMFPSRKATKRRKERSR